MSLGKYLPVFLKFTPCQKHFTVNKWKTEIGKSRFLKLYSLENMELNGDRKKENKKEIKDPDKRKTDETSHKEKIAQARKLKNLNKKNRKGETTLHTACIKVWIS